MPISPALRRAVVLSAALLPLATACHEKDDGPTMAAPVATTIAIASGDQQRGLAAEPLTSPLVVRVTDQNGQPMANVAVTWNVIAGGGSLAQTTTVTDGSGLSQNQWTLGRPTGTGSVAARIGALATQTVTFTSTAFVP